LVLPRNDSILHGNQVLDVVVADSYDVTRVAYFVSGPGLAEASFATAASTKYGWIAAWNTSTVPNGTYTIDATVDDSGSRSVRTRPRDRLPAVARTTGGVVHHASAAPSAT
jgi:hypothetical protein